MSNLTGQIKSLLNDEALRQALTKESLQEMLTELDSNEVVIKDQDKTISALNDNEKQLKDELTNLRQEFKKVCKERDDGVDRLVTVEAREISCSVTEIRNEFELRRGDEFKELMHAAVKNTTFKRKVMGGVDYFTKDAYIDEKGMYVQPQNKNVSHGDTEITDTKE